MGYEETEKETKKRGRM